MKNKKTDKKITKKDCPIWNKCSVPKCPLDPDVDLRVALKDEEVCPYIDTK